MRGGRSRGAAPSGWAELTLGLALGALGNAGCVELDYLLQAGEGQLDLLCRARSLEDARRDPELGAREREMLSEVPEVKAFAEARGLIPTSSYESFVALDRPSVVYVMSVAPEFSLEPVRWTFPISGEVPYLGWFDKHVAQMEADRWARNGYDVDVRGASAYSTLGWFSDPVLSSMIPPEPDAFAELANTIFHESVHATVYIPGQSAFNEGLATFLGDALTVEYFEETRGPNGEELTTWQEGERIGKARQQRFHKAYVELSALYRSKQPEELMRAKKAALLGELRREVGFVRPINNATLASFSTYHGDARGFESLYAACDRSASRVIAVVKTMKSGDFDAKNTEKLGPVLEKLTQRCAESPNDAAQKKARPLGRASIE